MRIDDMLSQYQNEDFPELSADLDRLIYRAELLGYDPELLGGLIKKLVKKIKKRIKARKKKGGSGGVYSISTPSGTVSVGAGGVQVVRPYGAGEQYPAVTAPGLTVKRAGIMDMIQENPALLMIPAAALIFLLTQKKKSK